MSSYPYSQRYTPSMPAIEVALGAPETGCSLGPLTAILDTGADINSPVSTWRKCARRL